MPSLADALPHQGLVVSTHGRHCVVETDAGERVLCHPRGRQQAVVVGDRVDWQPSGDGGRIESVHERRSLLYRQDEVRSKSFAANVDQVLVLVAAQPEFSDSLLARALIAAADQGIRALIGLNKRDLQPAHAQAWARLAPYRAMGYETLALALKAGPAHDEGLAPLQARLSGQATVVLGPSGAGKSTLVNRLVPGAAAATGEISLALNSGRHTTTRTEWYWLDAARQAALIDSPGFQGFGLQQIEAARLASLMPDLRAHLGQCRFHNCTHRDEPGCAVREAVEGQREPAIDARRYALYREFHAELSAARSW